MRCIDLYRSLLSHLVSVSHWGFLICVRQCCWSGTSGTPGFRVVPMDGKADPNVRTSKTWDKLKPESEGLYKTFTEDYSLKSKFTSKSSESIIFWHVNLFGTRCHSTCLVHSRALGWWRKRRSMLEIWFTKKLHSSCGILRTVKTTAESSTFWRMLFTCTWEDWAVAASRTCEVFEDGMKTQLVNVVVSCHNGRKHQLWKPVFRKHFETLEKKRMQSFPLNM